MANSLKQYLPSPINQHLQTENAPLYAVKASTALLDLNKKFHLMEEGKDGFQKRSKILVMVALSLKFMFCSIL